MKLLPRSLTISLERNESHSYEIIIGHDFQPHVVDDIFASGFGSFYAVVCDRTTASLVGEGLVHQLRLAGSDGGLITVDCGEASKTLAVLEKVLEGFLRFGMDRSACVVAAGGGVVGDLAGFAAGCFMRGVNYIQMPTTLLAQVDSSIGGKVAVNIPRGKNYCGLFLQPRRVYIDTAHLLTLSDFQFVDGLAEVVKYAVIDMHGLSDFLLKNCRKILERESSVLIDVVEECCRIKARIVEADEKEHGKRIILNYGHTFGHALEVFSGYRMSHGTAVAYGLRAASRTARAMGFLNESEFNRHEALLDAFGLAKAPLEVDPEKIMSLMNADKKWTKGKPRYVLPRGIGEVFVATDIPKSILMDVLQVYKRGFQ